MNHFWTEFTDNNDGVYKFLVRLELFSNHIYIYTYIHINIYISLIISFFLRHLYTKFYSYLICTISPYWIYNLFSYAWLPHLLHVFFTWINAEKIFWRKNILLFLFFQRAKSDEFVPLFFTCPWFLLPSMLLLSKKWRMKFAKKVF